METQNSCINEFYVAWKDERRCFKAHKFFFWVMI